MLKDVFNANAARFADEYWDVMDFLRSTDVTAWTDTAIVGAGTALAQLGSVKGGWARSISAAADTNGRNIQLAGGASAAATIFEANKPVKWASRFTMNSTTNGQFFAGLGLINSTTLFGTAAADWVGVKKTSASTVLTGTLRQGGNELTTVLDMSAFVAATAVTFLVEIEKYEDTSNTGKVKFWGSAGVGTPLTFVGHIDTTATVKIPANTRFLTPSFEFIAANGSGALSFDIDAMAWGGRR